MKERISRRDWEQLSAYVDGQLSAREQARIEERLQTDISLREALDDLRMTRIAVKALPHLHAPRNFTLMPEMAEMAGQRQKRTPRLFSTFRLASVVSSLLFVMVLLGDFLGFGRVGMSPAQEMAVPVAEKAFEAVEEADEMEAAEEPAPPAVMMEAEPEEEALPMAEERGVEEAVGEISEDAESLGAIATPMDISPSENQVLEEPSAPLDEPAPGEGLADAAKADAGTPRDVPAPFGTIRVVEILLGVIALVSGVLAVSLHQRERL